MEREVDWRGKTVVELREALRRKHLDIAGSKQTLVARLESNAEAEECERVWQEIREIEKEILL